METNRLTNESLKQFQTRLCRNKDLYSLTWNDVARLINSETGDSFGADKYQKWWSVYSEALNDFILENLSGSILIKEMDKQKFDLEKKKIQFQDKKREYTSLVRYAARTEVMKEEMLQVVKDLAESKPLQWDEPVVYDINPVTREAVILISDLHKGLFAQNFWNVIDDEEFNRRIVKLTKKIIAHCRAQGAQTIHVFILGDLVNGIIHVSTRVLSTQDVKEQTMSVAEALAEVVWQLSMKFDNVHVYNCRGNHDRVTPGKEEQLNGESFADFVPWFMKERLKHCLNVSFHDNEFDDEIIVADVLGEYVFGVHGHKDKPLNAISDLTLMLRKFPTTVVMGHYHHAEENENHGIDVIVNPTFSGVDEYAVNIRKTSKAAQKLLIYEKGQGRICTYNIRLDTP